MDQKIELCNGQKAQTPSLFFNQCAVEENKSSKEIDAQFNMPNQRFYIQSIYCQPQNQHEGDIQISYQTIQAEVNESVNKSLQEFHNNSAFKSQQELKQFSSKNNYLNEEQLSCQVNFQQDQSSQCSPCLKGIEYEHKQNSSSKEESLLIDYSKQISSDSKNLVTKNDSNNLKNNNELEYQDSFKCSQILIQDEIIYEKSLKKLGTRVNVAIKSQYLNRQESVSKQKGQQNFQKASNIISRLLKNSMNRIMRIRQNVKSFVQNLKIRHLNRRMCDLNEREYQIINDLSFFYYQNAENRQNYKFLMILSRIMKIFQFIPIFMPTDTFRVIWDMAQVAFTYIFFYFYSIIIFFDQNDIEIDFIKKICFFAFIIFLFDSFINLNTAFFDKDTIITQRKLIVKQYFFSSIFITDVVSLLALGHKIIYLKSLASNNLNQNLIIFAQNIIIFIKLNGVSNKRKRFDYIFTLTENQKHIIKLVNQLATVITVAHIGIYLLFIINFNQSKLILKAAIGWYFIGSQEQNDNQINWLDKLGISQQSYYQKYIYSIYWSITTMTTVGYGDISATNSLEALYITVAMILFSCVFAYSINNIGFILQEIERSSKQLNDDLTTIQRYLKRKDINNQLKSRVRHYLSFLAQEQKDRDKQQEDKILSIISLKLRNEITKEINNKILSSSLIFSSNFSKQTLDKLIFIMKEILVNPNEVIISEDQCDDSSIYFIQNGIIEIFQQQIQKQNNITILKTLSNGSIFGEISFFSGLQRQSSARSVNLSTLYKIKREEFIEILKENSEDFERFKMMQDQIIFQKEISIAHSECYNCKSYGHLSNQCPRTHKYFDKQFIILKSNFSLFQDRYFKERNYFKYKKRVKGYYKDNQVIIQRLKENFLKENDENYLMFTKDENIITDCTQQSYYENEDDYEEEDCEDQEDESYSSIPQKFEEKASEVQKNYKKCQQTDKIEKQVKSINKVNSIVTNNEEIDQFMNLENQISSFHSNLVYENNQDIAKVISNTFNSQVKTRSFDAYDSFDPNIQDPQTFTQQKSGYYTESNKVYFKKDTKPEISYNIMNLDEEDSSVSNSKKTDKSKLGTQNINIQFSDYLKSQMKQGPCYSSLNMQLQKQFTNQSVDDNSLNQNQDNQMTKNIKNEKNKRKSKHNRLSNAKKDSTQGNQFMNYSQKELRCSVEQMILQNIISMSLLQDKRQSQLHNKNNENIQDKNGSYNNNNSNKTVDDNNEKANNQYLPNKSSRYFSQKDPSQGKLQQQNQQQQPQQLSNSNIKQNSNENLQLLERFSKMFQENQLPLLLQLTTGKSFLQDSQFLSQNSMDYFDKMQQFKKYYPKSNFDKILHKIKLSQQEQRKQKKVKLASKERRQNIAFSNLTNIGILQGNTNAIMQQEYDINLYKPTFLSYGTKMQRDTKYPINAISQIQK